MVPYLYQWCSYTRAMAQAKLVCALANNAIQIQVPFMGRDLKDTFCGLGGGGRNLANALESMGPPGAQVTL